MNKTWLDRLAALRPCAGALEWAETQPSLAAAWRTCERGDWMLWLAARCGVSLRRLTAAKAACARLVYKHMTDERSRKAVRVAERFGRGQATRKELDAAVADAAYAAYAADAYADAADAYAADAAHAAADADAAAAAAAAYAADAAACAAYADAYAAAAADAAADADAAAADAAAAARRLTLARCAKAVRRAIKRPPRLPR